MAKYDFRRIPAYYRPAREGTHRPYRVKLYTRAHNNYKTPLRTRMVVATDPFAKAGRGIRDYDFGTANSPKED